MVATTCIEMVDGRSLNVYETGDPAGAAVVFHHGGFSEDEERLTLLQSRSVCRIDEWSLARL